jgi:hypothetical protein
MSEATLKVKKEENEIYCKNPTAYILIGKL